MSRIDLITEQETALGGFLDTQSEKAQEMIGTVRAQGREAMSAMRQELQEETNKQVEAVLTEDQIPEYHKIRA